MTPKYQIIAGTQDITDRIKDRLLSLTLTDNTDGKSGTVRITLDNAKLDTAAPEPDSVLTIHLGFAGASLRNMGQFTVDECGLSGGKSGDVIEVAGKAASYATDPQVANKYAAMQGRKTRSWESGTTIGAMVSKMASESGLAHYTSRSSSGVALPHTDQTDESDIALLKRIGAANNAWINMAYGRISFVDKRDVTAINTNAAETTPVTVRRGDVTSYSFKNKKRNAYASVRATYQNLDAAKTDEVTIGEGDPVFPITTPFPTIDAARRAADSKFIELMRAGKTLDITMPAPAAMNLIAGGTINAEGFDAQVNGPWKITSVDWALNKSGLRVSVKCEPTETDATQAG